MLHVTGQELPSPSSEWQKIAAEPFVLLEFEGIAKLYRGGDLVETATLEEVPSALVGLKGRSAAGFLSYEAGFAFEPKLRAERRHAELPLLWFMVGCACGEAPRLPDPAGAWVGAPSPLIHQTRYVRTVERIGEHILDGDIYQANFTFPCEVRTLGHPLTIYAQLRERAAGQWSAVVFTGTHWTLSFSPELFFTCEDGLVTCKPMKGTAGRDSDPHDLQQDPKQRSENLMIVDLLRNDLSRVAEPGSVRVPQLFAVESYPTILQMTSTVTAQLQQGLGAIDLLKAVFPCGSITGAPKIRAMEIIDALETAPRGIYTGSIGSLSADGDAAFNVAIRTLVLQDGQSVAQLGLGSGIVADSRGEDEWNECKRKGAFVATPAPFNLIETMRIDDGGQLPDLDAHLQRLERSAHAFGFPLDAAALEAELINHAARHGAGRLRLELAPGGAIGIECTALPNSPELAQVVVRPRKVDREDFRLSHKTSDRSLYDEPRLESGMFEVLFTDEEGFLTEGSFTNLFAERDGRLITPPLSRGLLPGILRQRLLKSGEAMEGDLRLEDLKSGFYIGNALRGLIPARLGGSPQRS
jgi:para-aminobenzoate synthetase/4-amino-4-deoxychorismate lyase